MDKPEFLIQFSFVPGLSDGFFVRSRRMVRTAFREVFPGVREEKVERLIGSGNTVLRILITAGSIGASLVVAEMLKEFARDLWRVVKRLILPKERRSANQPPDAEDRIEIELRIGAFSMVESLSGLSRRSDSEVEEFLENEIARMYYFYSLSRPQIRLDSKQTKPR
jgi:hypothetical protein